MIDRFVFWRMWWSHINSLDNPWQLAINKARALGAPMEAKLNTTLSRRFTTMAVASHGKELESHSAGESTCYIFCGNLDQLRTDRLSVQAASNPYP